MRLLIHDRTEPGFNLACEEYFLTQTDWELDIFWRNAPVVVIGRNQDAEAEVNGDYLRDHGIARIRRMTGGGAVYHDLGNINYTHIRNYDGPVDFARFAQPMVSALRQLGVDAEFAGRNDILVGGKKISGTAQTLWKGRVLHHGTLLYDVNMENLTSVLRVSDEKYKGRGIASVAARVTNIKPLLNSNTPSDSDERDCGTLDFLRRIAALWDGAERVELTKTDMDAIETLRSEVYEQERWNLRKERGTRFPLPADNREA